MCGGSAKFLTNNQQETLGATTTTTPTTTTINRATMPTTTTTTGQSFTQVLDFPVVSDLISLLFWQNYHKGLEGSTTLGCGVGI